MRTLEQNVLNTVEQAISEAVVKNLSAYNNPLDELIKVAVAKHQEKIQKLFDDAIENVVVGGLKDSLETAISHKISKVLVSKMEGEIEKQANELRSSPEFRAKLTLAIGNLVKSFKA